MFNTINYLLHKKNKTGFDAELLENFNPFITTKAFSFYGNGRHCGYINDTLNVYSGIFKTKEEEFRFFDNVIPKIKWEKYEYIKKPKHEEVKEDPQQIPDFLSKRELDLYKTYCKYP